MWSLPRRNPVDVQAIQNPGHESTAGYEFDSTEVQCLREEITTRITLMHAVIALELAVLGTGLAVIAKPTYVMAALAAASSFLWLLWMDRSLYTYKVAAYLSVELAPRLSQLARRPVLGWETFLRRIEAGGQKSSRALYPGAVERSQRLWHSGRYAEWYVPLVFAVTPCLPDSGRLPLSGISAVVHMIRYVAINTCSQAGIQHPKSPAGLRSRA